jgi:hypothetical protein
MNAKVGNLFGSQLQIRIHPNSEGQAPTHLDAIGGYIVGILFKLSTVNRQVPMVSLAVVFSPYTPFKLCMSVDPAI